MRQAYDYWQDQPGNFRAKNGTTERCAAGLVLAARPHHRTRSAPRDAGTTRSHPSDENARAAAAGQSCVQAIGFAPCFSERLHDRVFSFPASFGSRVTFPGAANRTNQAGPPRGGLPVCESRATVQGVLERGRTRREPRRRTRARTCESLTVCMNTPACTDTDRFLAFPLCRRSH